MSEIVVLVPVLGREQAIRPLYDSLSDATEVPWRLRFLCSPGDEPAYVICGQVALNDSRVSVRVVSWEPQHADWAKKINLGYRETEEDFILLGATDLRFHPGWDTAALDVADATGAGVIGTNDLGNATVMRGHHSTHPLIRRAYVEQYGTIDEEDKILHEGYCHQWVDTELCETAMARGQWAFAKNSHVEHLHFMWGKSERDATYDKALSTTREDHRLYGKRRALWHRRSPLLAAR